MAPLIPSRVIVPKAKASGGYEKQTYGLRKLDSGERVYQLEDG